MYHVKNKTLWRNKAIDSANTSNDVKRGAKNTVFLDLFSIPKYQLQVNGSRLKLRAFSEVWYMA